jgi:hypothetical protein
MKPFTITLFATTGDPTETRHVFKSNWSGQGVVFNREDVGNLANEPGINGAAVYILVGSAAEETVYIGEADPVGERLKSHVANKEGWSWGVYFFDNMNYIGKTEIQYLESSLVTLAKKFGRAVLMNKNHPTEPSMAAVSKANAASFLDDIILLLPLLGITAFTPSKSEAPEATVDSFRYPSQDISTLDTIIVPARSEGYDRVFLGQHRWYAIRIHEKQIPKLKYIAGYQVAPVAAITHIAEISSIHQFEDSDKMVVNFKAPAVAVGPIRRGNEDKVIIQGPRYASHEKILAAKSLDDVWK